MSAPDFTIDRESSPGTAILRGVMRLESVEAYDRVLAPVRAALADAPAAYTIDVAGLIFLNSSGIRALGDLVLFARNHSKRLVLRGSATVPWQKKTFVSLEHLYDQLEIQLG